MGLGRPRSMSPAFRGPGPFRLEAHRGANVIVANRAGVAGLQWQLGWVAGNAHMVCSGRPTLLGGRRDLPFLGPNMWGAPAHLGWAGLACRASSFAGFSFCLYGLLPSLLYNFCSRLFQIINLSHLLTLISVLLSYSFSSLIFLCRSSSSAPSLVSEPSPAPPLSGAGDDLYDGLTSNGRHLTAHSMVAFEFGDRSSFGGAVCRSPVAIVSVPPWGVGPIA